MLNIDLSFENSGIHVITTFIPGNASHNISFTLNKTLNIISITDEHGKKYTADCEGIDLMFHPELNKYTINLDGSAKNIIVEYCGKITNGYHNIITDDCKALSWYSGWYPQKPIEGVDSIFPDTIVNIHNVEDCTVIKGTKKDGIWTYKPLDFDVNVIVLKNYNQVKFDCLSFTYLKSFESDISKIYEEYIGKIIDYYRSIYEFESLPPMDIVVLPNTNPYDGYVRKQLIVLGGFNKNNKWAIKLMAHEIAHIWCTGADACSFEDWLNETFAEWSALLFVADNLGTDEFEKVIDTHRKDNLPPIKTADGKRPEKGVHDKGTLMVYELYLKYGKDLIVKMLKIFNSLQVKTTSEFLKSMRSSNLSDAADYIESSLCK